MKKYLLIGLALLIIVGCFQKNGKELKTNSGFRYILYTQAQGPKVKKGDYVTIEMVYRNDKDSVLYDSRKANVPLRFELDRIPFLGSFEDGLTNLSLNDSATFFVPADSLYNYLFKNLSLHENVPQKETAFTPKSFLKFEIKILNIQSPQDAEVEQEIIQSTEEKNEEKLLNKYLYDNGIKEKPDSSGYVLIIKEKGKGATVDSGKVITVQYEGRFLDGRVFDGTKKVGRNYQFLSGAHHVIKGWELAMKNLKAGDKMQLILPSRLAYGKEGIRSAKDATYIVPPNTPLVFDITILSVEEVPPVSGN